jgi:hypothetical protein
MNQISQNEISLLNSILPEYKPGYKKYRDYISSMKYLCEGRFGNGNYYIGTGNTEPDLSIPSNPVFALGYAETEAGKIDILIHEYEDEIIEVHLTSRYIDSEKITILRSESFSEWNPGDLSPIHKKPVNEIQLRKNEYYLVLDESNNKIWLHNYESGVNHIIPVSNYFNELMRLKKIKDENLFRSPQLFFNRLDDFTDEDFKLAFYQYNKFMRRFNIKINPEDLITPRIKKKKFFKIFSKG